MWHVYILQCGDKTFYTGIAKDVKRRIEAHRSGKGSRYTRCHLPVRLLYQELRESHGDALKREAELKKWPRAKKWALIKDTRTNKKAENLNAQKTKKSLQAGNRHSLQAQPVAA